MNTLFLKASIVFGLIILLSATKLFSQDVYNRNSSADVQEYIFALSLNDDNNQIKGEAEITVDFKNEVNEFFLDLMAKSGDYGMTIDKIIEGERIIDYRYVDNKIKIVPSSSSNQTRTYKIYYHGTPERGLVIDTTKFGRRSFFGDNWPNLARHWLPSVDHPYDKASVEFQITAPEHYDVVASGEKIEESSLGNGFKLTIYKEPAPVAMKVVTIGVTKFASRELEAVYDIPVSAWVYPENRLEGFHDYAVASKVLKYFVDRVGPYSYAKLANMQAKTQWGGLENAGNISYFENSVTGKNEVEGLIAHEIAHQWFGNSASENDWNHVWLSEGFATYFAILYQEEIYGNEKRKEELVLDKKQIIEYYQRNPSPIVDPSITDPLKVLSANTYQKGGWVLNMLRHRLGDEIFWEGIRAYYKAYRNSNAMTDDFQSIMETVSNQKLTDFFTQWIFTKGYPELKWNWKYSKGKLKISIEQIQKHQVFNFPLEIGITTGDTQKIETFQIDKSSQKFEIDLKTQPDDILLDPELWLLFDVK